MGLPREGEGDKEGEVELKEGGTPREVTEREREREGEGEGKEVDSKKGGRPLCQSRRLPTARGSQPTPTTARARRRGAALCPPAAHQHPADAARGGLHCLPQRFIACPSVCGGVLSAVRFGKKLRTLADSTLFVAARNGGDNMQLMIERTGLFVMSVSLAGSCFFIAHYQGNFLIFEQ